MIIRESVSEFLLKRITEWELVAHDAMRNNSGAWKTGLGMWEADEVSDSNELVIIEGDSTTQSGEATHIAMFDPMTVLAVCDAWREIVESYKGEDAWEMRRLSMIWHNHPRWQEVYRP